MIYSAVTEILLNIMLNLFILRVYDIYNSMKKVQYIHNKCKVSEIKLLHSRAKTALLIVYLMLETAKLLLILFDNLTNTQKKGIGREGQTYKKTERDQKK